MRLPAWLRKLRKREDAEVLTKAKEMQAETPEEQKLTEGELTSIRADQQAARDVREPSVEDATRLGEPE